ncbi:MAG TPA: endonuclease/exonuclease/phosphatase family protein [Solirubrobacterales bacterium]|nr:endonuclease/exonuclease/phosphatase family protein [Solirubrobacterales bacterium]
MAAAGPDIAVAAGSPPPSAPPSGRDRAARLTIAFLAFLLFGWALGAVCTSVFGWLDLRAVRDIASDRTAAQVSAARVFSTIGSGYVVFPLAALACLVLTLRRRYADALTIGVGTFGAVLIATLDKNLVDRARPPVHHLQDIGEASFPSGHATQSTAFLVSLLIVLFAAHPPRWIRIGTVIASTLLILSIGISRVYLGVHYPSDVVFGALLGLCWSPVVAHGINASNLRWQLPDRATEVARIEALAGRAISVVVAGLAVATALSLLGQITWVLEPTTLFNLQYATLSVIAAAILAVLRRWHLVAVAILLAALNVAAFAPWQDGPPSAAAPSDPRLRIVSLNLDFANRDFEGLAPMIEELRPDILGVTELTPEWARTARRASSVVRPRLFVAQPGAYGIGVLSDLKPTAISAERFPAGVPETDTIVSRYRVGDRSLTVVFLHLHTPFAGLVHTEAMRAIADARPSFGPRLMICGDFNTVPWSAQFREFADSTDLIDVFQGSWPPWTWPAWSWLLQTPIDTCLVSDGIAVLDADVGPNIGSDHFSIVVDIAVTSLRR